VSELRAGPVLRWVRAGLTAVVACSLGLLAHVLAGGQLPAFGWIAVGVATVWAACAALLGRPAGRLRLVALVGGGQAAFHLMLTAVAGHGPGHATSHTAAVPSYAAVVADAQDRRGSYYDLTMAAAPADAAGWGQPHWLTHIAEDLTGPHAFMALAHLAAAAGVACWLALGEQAVWVLVCLLGASVLVAFARAVRPHLQPGALPGHARPTVRRAKAPLPVALPHRSRVQRRGPPPLRSTSLSPIS